MMRVRIGEATFLVRFQRQRCDGGSPLWTACCVERLGSSPTAAANVLTPAEIAAEVERARSVGFVVDRLPDGREFYAPFQPSVVVWNLTDPVSTVRAYIGIACRHPRDPMCHETGRKLALRRAVQRFSPSERRTFWEGYFAAKQTPRTMAQAAPVAEAR